MTVNQLSGVIDPTTGQTANTSSPITQVLPASAPPQTTGLPLAQYMASQVANPSLSTSQTMNPALLNNTDTALQASGQVMSPTDPGVSMTPAAPVNAPTTQPNATQVQTNTQQQQNNVNATGVVNSTGLNQATNGYQAVTTSGSTPQATAIQGSVNPLDTVAGQLTALYAQTGIGQVPTWAASAVTAANNAMAARGMGNSSIGAAAITAAVQQSALPIAAQDASTYFQMDMQNLSNQQQAEMSNIQAKQQAMLSDQAAVNAAHQFNASNYTQLQEFMGTLVSNISTQNADRNQAMQQFNAGQENNVALQNVTNSLNASEFTSSQQAAIDQFNSSQTFARDQFNAQAAYAIDQSNVTWRRNINTQNTAAINAANQVNVQNAFNMSQTSQNNLWQEWRDQASYSFTQSQNQAAMQFSAAMAANNQAFAQAQSGMNLAQAVGGFVSGLLI